MYMPNFKKMKEKNVKRCT